MHLYQSFDSSRSTSLLSHTICAIALLAFGSAGCGGASGSPASTSVESNEVSSTQTRRQSVGPGSDESWQPEGKTIEGHVPTPYVVPPVYGCAESVEVAGVIEGAEVRVLDPNGNVLGTGTGGSNGRAAVYLSNPLPIPSDNAFDTVRAEQELPEGESDESFPQRIRGIDSQDEMTKPTTRPQTRHIWACGANFYSTGLMKGLRTQMLRSGSQVETKVARWAPAYSYYHEDQTEDVHAGEPVELQQVYCPERQDETVVTGPTSKPHKIETNLQHPNVRKVGYSSARVGSRALSVGGMRMGADVDIYENGSLHFESRAIWRGVRYDLSDTVQSGDSFQVTQQLCGEESAPRDVQLVPKEDWESRMETPEVESPVCPEPRYVEASASIGTGRLLAYHVDSSGTSYSTQVEASKDARIGLPTPQNYEAGDTIEIVHAVEAGFQKSNTIHIQEALTQFTAGAKRTFDYQGDRPTTDEGFVREWSQGPTLELEQCCEEEGPPSITAMLVQLDGDGHLDEQVATVTLRRTARGHYSGRWDWFKGKFEPPSPNHYYVAAIESTDLPCKTDDVGDYATTDAFRVYTSQPDNSDSTEPSSVTLDVGNAQVSAGGNSDSITIDPSDRPVDVSVEVRDQQGIESLSVSATSPGQIASPSSKTTSPGNIKDVIPAERTIDTQLEETSIGPGESTDVTAQGDNFNGATAAPTTPPITVTVTQPQPTLDDPALEDFDEAQDRVLKDHDFDIDGEHLHYDNLKTRVLFRPKSSNNTYEVSSTADKNGSSSTIGTLEPDRLSDVSIPSNLPARVDTIEVEVKVGSSGNWKTSGTATFTLVDRRDTSFNAEVTFSDYKTSNESCSGGPVSSMNWTTGVTYESDLVFTYAGGSTTTIPVSTYSDSNYEHGGAWLSSDCQTALVLSCEASTCNDGLDGEPSFHLDVLHFENDGKSHSSQADVDLVTEPGEEFRNLLVVEVNTKAGLAAGTSLAQDGSTEQVGDNPKLKSFATGARFTWSESRFYSNIPTKEASIEVGATLGGSEGNTIEVTVDTDWDGNNEWKPSYDILSHL